MTTDQRRSGGMAAEESMDASPPGRASRVVAARGKQRG